MAVNQRMGRCKPFTSVRQNEKYARNGPAHQPRFPERWHTHPHLPPRPAQPGCSRVNRLGGRRRLASPELFAHAPRHHRGGIAGRLCCKPDVGVSLLCLRHVCALARRSCSHAMASVRTHGPTPKARSTIRASPTCRPGGRTFRLGPCATRASPRSLDRGVGGLHRLESAHGPDQLL